jgi:hypothetical protein
MRGIPELAERLTASSRQYPTEPTNTGNKDLQSLNLIQGSSIIKAIDHQLEYKCLILLYLKLSLHRWSAV